MDLSSIPRKFDTNDLHLRPSRLSDVDGMFAMLSDPESMKYWSSTPVTKIDDALEVLRQDLESDAKGNSMCWGSYP